MDGSVLAASIAAAPPTNMSRLVKLAMRPLLASAASTQKLTSTLEPFQLYASEIFTKPS